MATPRRLGAPDAKNRAVLLAAAERLMLESGYAAVSSRRVADEAGLKPQLVHYYFRTMDELFLELFRRRAEQGLEVQALALKSDQPLWALWVFSTDPAGAIFTMEFIALSNHRKELRVEIARISEQFRTEASAGIEEVLRRYGVDLEQMPAVAAIVLMTSISRVVVMEETLGVREGHAEMIKVVEDYLRELEGEPGPELAEVLRQRR
ncbi:helix-turn-helix domain-containing protein [Williamsia sp.]|uniref:TetR/AcrR family transcriptional regulator n=1 Tax=Williamsia sp. TaxID=1872085 RepID=UPI002F94DCF5